MELNPILAKDLGTGARRWRSYALRMVYVAVVIVGVWLWAAPELPTRHIRLSELAVFGRDIFQAFALIQFWLITLYALLAGAELFAQEVRTDTLGLLAITLLRPADLVRGKWLAAVAQAVYLMLCGLPILAVAVYLGGAGVSQIVAITTVTLASAMLAAALSIWASVDGRGLYGAVGVAAFGYGCSAVLLLFPSMLAELFQVDLFRYLHPMAAVLDALDGRGRMSWLSSGLVGAVGTGLVLKLASMRIDMPDALAPHLVRTSAEIESREEYDRNARENLGLGQAHGKVWDRFPLLWKELRTRPAAQVRTELRLIVGVSLAFIFLSSLMMDRYDHQKMFEVFVPIAILLTVAGGAGLFTRDREDRRWEPILGTPISSRRIVAVKLLSGPLSPEGATIAVLSFVCLLHLWRFPETGLLRGSVALGLFLLFVYCLSALASLVCRTQRTAMLLSGSVVATILLALPGNEYPRILLCQLHPYTHFDRRPGASLDLFILAYGQATVLLVTAILAVFRRTTGRA